MQPGGLVPRSAVRRGVLRRDHDDADLLSAGLSGAGLLPRAAALLRHRRRGGADGFRPVSAAGPSSRRARRSAMRSLAWPGGGAAHRGRARSTGRSVDALARELGVGGRQLRRAMERELGVSPVELAQTHRAAPRQVPADRHRAAGHRVAFASGFQSLAPVQLRVRERYRMSPSACAVAMRAPSTVARAHGPGLVRLTLGYRPPLAWDALLERLARDALRDRGR